MKNDYFLTIKALDLLISLRRRGGAIFRPEWCATDKQSRRAVKSTPPRKWRFRGQPFNNDFFFVSFESRSSRDLYCFVRHLAVNLQVLFFFFRANWFQCQHARSLQGSLSRLATKMCAVSSNFTSAVWRARNTSPLPRRWRLRQRGSWLCLWERDSYHRRHFCFRLR